MELEDSELSNSDVLHPYVQEETYVAQSPWARARKFFASIMTFLQYIGRGICSVVWSVWQYLRKSGEEYSVYFLSILQAWKVLPWNLMSRIDELASLMAMVKDCPVIQQGSDSLAAFFRYIGNCNSEFSGVLVCIGIFSGVVEGTYDTVALLHNLDYHGEISKRCETMKDTLDSMYHIASFSKELCERSLSDITKAHLQGPIEILKNYFDDFKHSFKMGEIHNIPETLKQLQADRCYSFKEMIFKVVFQAVAGIGQAISYQWPLLILNILTTLYEMSTNFAMKYLEQNISEVYRSLRRIHLNLPFGNLNENHTVRSSASKIFDGTKLLEEEIPKVHQAAHCSLADFVAYVIRMFSEGVSECAKEICQAILHPIETLQRFGKYVETQFANAYDVVAAALSALKEWMMSVFQNNTQD